MWSEVLTLSPGNEFTSLEQKTEQLRDLLRKHASATAVLPSLQKSIENFPREFSVQGTFVGSATALKEAIGRIIKILDEASEKATVRAEVESRYFLSLADLASFIEENILSSLKGPINAMEWFSSYPPHKDINNLSQEQKSILDKLKQIIELLLNDFKELKKNIESSSFYKPSGSSSLREKSEEIWVKARSVIDEKLLRPEQIILDYRKLLTSPTERVVVGNNEEDRFILPTDYWVTQLEARIVNYVIGIKEERYENLTGWINDAIGEIMDVKIPISGPQGHRNAYVPFELAKDLLYSVEKLNPPQASSTLNEENPEEKIVGGLDFSELEKYIQYDGSFKGLDFSLPLLSHAELEQIGPQEEQEALNNLLRSRVSSSGPSGDRLKRHLSRVIQKGQFTQRQVELQAYAQELCNFLSESGRETTPDQRAFILISATGLFLR